MPKRMLALRLDEELLDGLRRIRERVGIPVSEQIRRAILAWLDTMGETKRVAKRKGDDR